MRAFTLMTVLYCCIHTLSSFQATSLLVLAQPMKRAVTWCPQGWRKRKSLASLTAKEKSALVSGFKTLKANGVLDKMARRHRDGMKYHGTVYFLTMHRALIKDFEDELIKANSGIPGLPYWDELLDAANPSRSSVFTTSLMGVLQPGQTHRIDQPFADLKDDSNAYVVRQPRNSAAGFSWAPQTQVLARILTRFASFGDMQRTIEISPHNQYHGYIGGHMGNPSISPSDPLFWLHHSYIDYLWAVWQSIRTANAENLSTWTGQPQLTASQPTVLYEGRYTNLDMLRYRTRLCYLYDTLNTAPQRRRMAKRQSSDNTTNISVDATSTTGNDTDTLDDTIDATATSVNDTVSATTPFLEIQPMPEDAIRLLMPNMTIGDWRAIESELNKAIGELNDEVKTGKIAPNTLDTIDDLFNGGNNTALSEDDGRDSAIAEIIAQTNDTSAADKSSDNSHSAAMCMPALTSASVVACSALLLLAC